MIYQIISITLFAISFILAIYSIIVHTWTTRAAIWNETHVKWFKTLMFTAPMSIVLCWASFVFFIPTIFKLLGEK